MNTRTDYLIEIKNLKKTYSLGEVLKNINLKISKGEFYALMACNGAGKSTLLNILMGIDRASKGDGHVLGVPLTSSKTAHKNKIGFVSEIVNFDLPVPMNKFIHHFAKFYSGWDYALFEKIVLERRMDLSKQFKDYSRGQKMQIIMTLALSISPELILIDEITSVLDLYARKYFINLIQKYVYDGGTVILTTNIINEIQHVATQMLFLNDGEIQLNCPVNDIPEKFVKLRKLDNICHPVFNHPECYWAGINSDSSISYLIPANLAKKYKLPESIIDNRSIHLDEVFIYYLNNKIKNEDSNE